MQGSELSYWTFYQVIRLLLAPFVWAGAYIIVVRFTNLWKAIYGGYECAWILGGSHMGLADFSLIG
jgi:hypothetical protein